MPQILQCYKCAAQNPPGMHFCTTCGEKFIYKCPQCSSNIEPDSEYCPGCSARLDWGTKAEQSTDAFTKQGKLAENEQIREGERKSNRKEQYKQKRLSPWLIAFIIVLLLIIAIFAIDTMSNVLFIK